MTSSLHLFPHHWVAPAGVEQNGCWIFISSVSGTWLSSHPLSSQQCVKASSICEAHGYPAITRGYPAISHGYPAILWLKHWWFKVKMRVRYFETLPNEKYACNEDCNSRAQNTKEKTNNKQSNKSIEKSIEKSIAKPAKFNRKINRKINRELILQDMPNLKSIDICLFSIED